MSSAATLIRGSFFIVSRRFAARVGKVTASRSSDVVAELENKKPSRAATTRVQDGSTTLSAADTVCRY